MCLSKCKLGLGVEGYLETLLKGSYIGGKNGAGESHAYNSAYE